MTEEDKKDFVVRDKRIFSDEAESEPEKAASETESEDQEPPPEEAEPAAGEKADDMQMPEMNFPTFVFSLNASALFHLGMVEDPSTGKKEKNLPLAKQTIDILGMLEEKTKGNLSGDEENLLKNILTDLRLMYVKESSA